MKCPFSGKAGVPYQYCQLLLGRRLLRDQLLAGLLVSSRSRSSGSSVILLVPLTLEISRRTSAKQARYFSAALWKNYSDYP
jgi:hypothetical protein